MRVSPIRLVLLFKCKKAHTVCVSSICIDVMLPNSIKVIYSRIEIQASERNYGQFYNLNEKKRIKTASKKQGTSQGRRSVVLLIKIDDATTNGNISDKHFHLHKLQCAPVNWLWSICPSCVFLGMWWTASLSTIAVWVWAWVWLSGCVPSNENLINWFVSNLILTNTISIYVGCLGAPLLPIEESRTRLILVLLSVLY